MRGQMQVGSEKRISRGIRMPFHFISSLKKKQQEGGEIENLMDKKHRNKNCLNDVSGLK